VSHAHPPSATPLLPIAEALHRVLAETPLLPAVRVPLAEARGRVLREEARADADQPAFDRAMMDGFAVKAGNVGSYETVLRVAGESRAGAPYGGALGPGEAVRIMTGAIVPPGADAVVPVEWSEVAGDAAVRLRGPAGRETNIARRGSEVRKEDLVLAAGVRLDAPRLGALGAFGHAMPLVGARPRVCLLPTGDEIVPVDVMPRPGQVRDSNRHVVAALVEGAGAVVTHGGPVPDDLQSLRQAIAEGLEASDVVMLSGGVSMGDYDLVGRALAALHVQTCFHRVAMKPGKPLLFALRDDGSRRVLVFGLPGNPVSSYLTALLFTVPALMRAQGLSDVTWAFREARAAAPFGRVGERDEIVPLRLDGNGVSPLRTAGSADLAGYARADALALRPSGAAPLGIGDAVTVFDWPRP